MTLNDIKKEVAHLGFEGESAIDSGSIESALRRALFTIYTEHGAYSRWSIYQNSLIPAFHVPEIVHKGGEDSTIALDGRAYALVVSGTGTIEIKDGNGVRAHSFSTPYGYVYGKLTGDAEMHLKGEFCYTVYDLCVYDEVFEDGYEPPKYTAVREYDLTEAIPDFLCAAGEPADRFGNKIPGASISSGMLLLPYEYKGEIVISYRKRAPRVSIDTPDVELNIPAELESLVPLLTAAYVWLDDSPEKAQYYMSLYRDGMSGVKLYTRRNVDTKVTDVTGWA